MKLRITEKLNRGDDLYTVYRSENGFIQAIDEVENITERINAVLSGLKIHNIENKTMKDIATDLNIAEEDAHKLYGYTFILNINGLYMPIRESSLLSLQDRFKIYGGALSKVSKDKYVQVLNICREVVQEKEECLVVKIGNKISAVLSDGYKILHADKVFKIAKKSSLKLGGEFTKGIIGHDIMSCEYRIFNPLLIKKYADILNESDKDGFKLSVAFSTSNIGCSAVNAHPIYTKIGYRGREVSYIMGKAISIEHRGSADINKVDEAFDGIFAMIEHSIQKMSELKNIKIKNPAQCFLNAAKTIGLNKKYALEAYADFLGLGLDETTAYDIYAGLAESVFYAQEDDKSEIYVINMKEIVARALTLNWKTVDVPFSIWLKVEIKSASASEPEEVKEKAEEKAEEETKILININYPVQKSFA